MQQQCPVQNLLGVLRVVVHLVHLGETLVWLELWQVLLQRERLKLVTVVSFFYYSLDHSTILICHR